jgi:hypothetical protein
MKFLAILKGLFDRLFIIIGAFLGSQIPEFMNQYTQRLSGHAAELNQLIAKLTQMASLSNKTLDQYINKFLLSSDPDFANQGEFMKGVVSRWQDLNITLYSLSESTIWTKPYYFFKYLNYPIADSTFQTFKPGISLTVEGLCYIGVGIIIAFIIYQMMMKLFYVIYTLFSPKTPTTTPLKSGASHSNFDAG